MDDDDFDKFTPLTVDEIISASMPASCTPKPDGGELVSPIPTNAPRPPSSHPKWGQPSMTWTYRDANGTPLQIICRFEPVGERKQFAPLTLWREARGLRWRWKGHPSPRPLYGLDSLGRPPRCAGSHLRGREGGRCGGASVSGLRMPDLVRRRRRGVEK